MCDTNSMVGGCNYVSRYAAKTHIFPCIQECDQQLILETSWAQLFILSLAQWSVPLQPHLLLRDSCAAAEEEQLLAADLRQLEDILTRLSQLR